MGDDIRATRPDALIVVAAEHFANFFMNNMPAYAMGMADRYEGPIEDPRLARHRAHAHPRRRRAVAASDRSVMQTVDVAYAEEWKFDHGIMVPLHFLTPRFDLPVIPVNINCQGPPLTPLHRAWAFGEALRRACDAVPERIALVGTGGISHWPATPDSGKINEAWDRDFLDRWCAQRQGEAMLSYTDEETYRDAGQGGFEIRTFITVAAAARGPGRAALLRADPEILRCARDDTSAYGAVLRNVTTSTSRCAGVAVLGLDRGDAVVDARVVHQRGIEWVGEREAAERCAVGSCIVVVPLAMLRRCTSSTST